MLPSGEYAQKVEPPSRAAIENARQEQLRTLRDIRRKLIGSQLTVTMSGSNMLMAG